VTDSIVSVAVLPGHLCSLHLTPIARMLLVWSCLLQFACPAMVG
jgi:hypothetical protein